MRVNNKILADQIYQGKKAFIHNRNLNNSLARFSRTLFHDIFPRKIIVRIRIRQCSANYFQSMRKAKSINYSVRFSLVAMPSWTRHLSLIFYRLKTGLLRLSESWPGKDPRSLARGDSKKIFILQFIIP